MSHDNDEFYRPNGLFLGYFDHSSAIRLGADTQFNADRMAAIRKAFRDRCRQMRGRTDNGELFEPRFATSFGHTDDVAFAVIDDFAAISHAASCSPQLESYTVAYTYSPALFQSNSGASLLVDPWPSVDVADDMPLVAVSHIKLNGLLSLAFGVTAQVAAASLILDRIAKTRKTFRETKLRQKHDALYGNDPKTIFDQLRVAILDPIAGEDLLLITFCTNYSAAISALSAVRKTTFADLWQHSLDSGDKLVRDIHRCHDIEASLPSKGPRLTSSELLKKFASLGTPSTPHRTNSTLDSRLSGNHLVSSTYTTLGVIGEIQSFPRIANKVSGFVSVRAFADVSPGHESVVMRQINRQLAPGEHLKADEDYRLALMGRHDLSVEISSSESSPKETCVELSDYLRFVSKLFSVERTQLKESGFQDITTNLGVPVPAVGRLRDDETADGYGAIRQLIDPPVDHKQHTDTMLVLEKVEHVVSEKMGLNDIRTLDENLTFFGLGPSARSSAIGLFTEFSSCLSDPLLNDCVLDLTDSFLACSNLISQTPAWIVDVERSAKLAAKSECRLVITMTLEALRHALEMRIGRSSAKREEQSGVLRGSITNLLSAGDTALKCSLGLIRSALHPDNAGYSFNRLKVTGVIAHNVDQRATATNSRIGNMRSSIVCIDTNHAFRPDYLSRVLHEVAHLYFECFVAESSRSMKSGYMSSGFAADLEWEQVYTRATELFADGVVHGFIFGHNSEAFIRNHICEFESIIPEIVPRGAPSHASKSVVTFAMEMLYRVFLICNNV